MNSKDLRRQFRFLAIIGIFAMLAGLFFEFRGIGFEQMWVVASLVLAIAGWFYADWKVEKLREEIKGETKQ